MAYPMGLPEWDTVRLTIEGNGGLDGTAAGQELLDPNTSELWIASRALDRGIGRLVADRLGRNEKTKVVSSSPDPPVLTVSPSGDCQASEARGRSSWPRAGRHGGGEELHDGILLQEARGVQEALRERRGRLPPLVLGRPQTAAEVFERARRCSESAWSAEMSST
jgi:hypothetical protein